MTAFTPACSEGKTCSDWRFVACCALFAVSYACLLPGLCLLLFSAKAEIDMFGKKMTIVDLEKSTLGTVKLLYDAGAHIPLWAILTFSVVMPFVKLAALLHFALAQTSTLALLFAQHISKWATIDAFAAAALIAFFTGQPMLHVDLHAGFYFFLAYCILSTAAAVAFEEAAQRSSGAAARAPPAHARSAALPRSRAVPARRHGGGALAGQLRGDGEAAACGSHHADPADALAAARPCQDLLDLGHDTPSWSGGCHAAAVSIALLVIALPAADFAVLLAGVVGLGSAEDWAPRGLEGRWLQDFAMLDVWMLAMVVTRFATTGINGAIEMEVLPAGW
eukprot:CAMPEP_0179013224 /NCGR_PEP_ID=MMETSP0796-20121207/1614_1 /TAXON_ID=73915 /ORGANISM="Pyrodinium bahamense, Strain pbaha01" /LENGTH=334 /DNA_ID=CAMNT_0020708717 /DNA_START=47 /DNA_END=1048 /DNA_ORIENTATION=+